MTTNLRDGKVPRITAVNDFVVKFANVNGSGSASANELFARSLLRMGVPVSPRNIFPSNIQGLPTWYEVRVSERGYLARRGGVDLMVAMNPQTWDSDLAEIEPGGYLLYDSSKPLPDSKFRGDVHVLGVPLTDLCATRYTDPRERQLLKNIVYVGVLAALLGVEPEVIATLLGEQYKGKTKLLQPNLDAFMMGLHHGREYFDDALGLRLERRDAVGKRIFMEGNAAAALGCVYGGATVCAWYPIASIGIVVGAGWNGARAFTATSGPGVSLMTEFIGLAYFAEIPVTIIDVQRGGPSTGMPTRTQQADLLACAYASHGDTKHVLLFPEDPHECFDFGATALDLADRLQTPVFVMTDLDIGMNHRLCEPLAWDDARTYDRGKVMTADELEAGKDFGRYLDVDGDGIPYRTLPGTHPSRGSFFTRGTTRDAYARYSEAGPDYIYNVTRLLKKFETAKELVPQPVLRKAARETRFGVIHFGSTSPAMNEAFDALQANGVHVDLLRVRAFPFSAAVDRFVAEHETVFVVEQNRDAQLRTMLVTEQEIDPAKLEPILHYDGTPITARFIIEAIAERVRADNVEPLAKKGLAA
jgi:2-oxoglutarate ferredoxin oxidoreductase subunit alpha